MSAPAAVTIRAAQQGDVDALARLSGGLGYPASPEQIGARLKAIAPDRNHAVFVAEAGTGGVVGWVHVYLYQVLEADPRAEIGGLVTDPAMRRQGIGRALMQRAEAWAGERGLSVVSLRTNIKRTEAHQFYAQLGYTAAKTQHNFRKQL